MYCLVMFLDKKNYMNKKMKDYINNRKVYNIKDIKEIVKNI